ncbi:hypothetical protein RBSH_00231 [Rhodopirellula baltica SH28]|uniref:Uncharacterized protein n=4 Tax=Rhodopirellula baltica TaxID=265606 RepID=Q7UEJ0_RHOBA|nr:hypothetical protein RBWH47_02877 [Rhodopirellula baltica WH47]EKK04362.1 hypothetical protein RBSH_00231 [Rhodopirellula baltica SH28]ELP30174.1 hypothetical protein RBSWK_05932 [Rhodopirellula baltica SWK14]CAD79046.1 hypothetical protein RB11307 [Rhodopirellula baltica SH 1]
MPSYLGVIDSLEPIGLFVQACMRSVASMRRSLRYVL